MDGKITIFFSLERNPLPPFDLQCDLETQEKAGLFASHVNQCRHLHSLHRLCDSSTYLITYHDHRPSHLSDQTSLSFQILANCPNPIHPGNLQCQPLRAKWLNMSSFPFQILASCPNPTHPGNLQCQSRAKWLNMSSLLFQILANYTNPTHPGNLQCQPPRAK